jgi:MYXO-CTERM domain-containing protein
MADAARRPKRARRWQARIAVVLFSLFPLGVLAGLLSPGVITLQAAQTWEAVTPAETPPPLDLESVDFKRSPLLVPRDFSAGFIPELLDLEQLFRDADLQVETTGERLARLLAFPRSHGDAIVLDDLDGVPLDLLFDDALVGDTIASIPSGVGDAFGLGPLGSLMPLGNGVRFDDFPGGNDDGPSGTVVPEPDAGLMLALGLVALGLRRRRYLQPIGR